MKITRCQLRRIIREAGGPYGPTWRPERDDPPRSEAEMVELEGGLEDLEPERFRSKDEAEDAAVDMVFDGGTVRMGDKLPWEVRIVSIYGEYALYAMKSYTDRYEGEGKEIAAVPRGGSIRYGWKIG